MVIASLLIKKNMPEMIEILALACGRKESYAWLEAIAYSYTKDLVRHSLSSMNSIP